MSSVGAIWRLDSEYSKKITSGWNDGLFVIISSNGKSWAGTFPTLIAHHGGLPGIGDPMPTGITVSVDQRPPGYWAPVLDDLLSGGLGPPNEGINPLPGLQVQAANTCTCDLYIMMNNGCPSTTGGTCPDLH